MNDRRPRERSDTRVTRISLRSYGLQARSARMQQGPVSGGEGTQVVGAVAGEGGVEGGDGFGKVEGHGDNELKVASLLLVRTEYRSKS